LALALALAALAVVTVLARRTFGRLELGSEARQQAYDVLMSLRKLRQDVGEMRVGVTGYVLTRDSIYLATYRSGLKGLATDTTAIRRLTAAAPSLQQELDRLQPKLGTYVADLAATLHLVEGQPAPSTTLGPVPSRSGMLIEAIRPHFVALESEQLRLLEVSALEVRRAVTRTNTIFTWVLLIGVVVLLGTSALLFVHLHTRAQAEARLARAREQLHESQRLEALGQLAGGVAHDFNNVLTVIGGLCDLLQLDLPADHPSQPDLALLREAVRQGADLTRQLLAFGRRQVLELRVLDLNAVVRQFSTMLDRVIPENIDVNLLLADDLGRVRADPGQLEQILMNLAVNARDAMLQGGRLTIETANGDLDLAAANMRQDVKPGQYVVLIVTDTGAGMDEATRARIFEPFFTTKQAGKGTGLGLATVYGIVKQSGGHIWVYSEPSHGSTFKLYLPRVDQPPTPELPRSATAGSPMGTETILLVEDDDRVREVTRRILSSAGYRILLAASPEAALDLLTRNPEPMQLLLTDVVLPGMSGPQLAHRVLSLKPGIRVLYQSGYSDAAIAQHGALESGAALLPKPFTANSLKRKVREVLDAPVAG
jgi:signal transduction histidine kinase